MSLLEFIQTHAGDGFDSTELERCKQTAALAALDMVESGMVLGLGTGSTVAFFLKALSERVKQGLKVSGVPTSVATEKLARELGIPLAGEGEFSRLDNDLCVDGADRVDAEGHLIKGGGGALFREKMVAGHSRRVVIMVDPTKLVLEFGPDFALPVECLPFGRENLREELETAGCQAVFRRRSDGESLFRTDNGNLIADCRFQSIPQPRALELRLKSLAGVLEVGLFSHMMDTLLVGTPRGQVEVWQVRSASNTSPPPAR